MSEVEIKPLLTTSTFTPEEAMDNIIGAKALGITPDNYAEDKVRLKPDVEASKLPDTVPPIMAEKMDNRSIASLIKPDVTKLSYAERQMGYFSEKLKAGDIGRRRNQAAVNIMLNGENEENLFELVSLNSKMKDIEAAQQAYDLSFGETIPSEVANVAVDQARMIRDEYKTVAAIGAVSAAAGGAIGFLGGLGVPLPGSAPVGAGAGAIGGLIASLRYGPKAALYKDSLSQSAGELYAELTAPSEDGKLALSREQAIPFALGGGAIIASLDVFAADKLLKKIPALKKWFNPREFAKEVMKAENKAVADAIQKFGASAWVKDILKGAAAEGATEAAQEIISTAVKNTATSELKGRQALQSGLWDALTNIDTLMAAAKAGAVGAVAGGGFTAVGKAIGSVTPEKKGSVEAPAIEQTPVADTLGLNNNLPKSIAEQSYKAYHVAEAIAEQALLRKDTKFKELTPDEHDQLLRRQAEFNGVESVYADSDALTEFANTEEKAADIQAAMDNSANLEPGQNAPVRFDTEKAVNLQMKYPEFSQVLKDSPEGISVSEYKKILEERQKAANEILQKNQNVAQVQVQENVTQENPEVLYHGTDRMFETFEQGAKTNKYPNTQGGMFFTQDPTVADRFSWENRGGTTEIGMDMESELNNASEKVFNLLTENDKNDGQITQQGLKDYADDALKNGQNVMYTDNNGNRKQYTSDIPKDEINTVKVFKSDRAPRVIETTVYGPTLDITQNIPEELIVRLENGNKSDKIIADIAKRYKGDYSGFRSQMGANYTLVPNATEFQKYVKEKGFTKVKMPDSAEFSGGVSYYVPDVKNIGTNITANNIAQAEEILTQQEIAPRQLTPEQQTLVDARGDLYLNDIKNKNLSDKQLADMVVTRERAQYVIDETQAEIDDIKAGNNIEIMASASTNEQLESMVKTAKPGSAKIKDGRTVEFIPSVQENGVPVVTARINGELAGSVRMHLERQNGKNVTTPAMTQVEAKFRRKGVATAMYEYIREKVVRLEHSNIQLPDGKAFAQGSRKKGTGVFKVPDTEKLDAIKKRLLDIQPLLPSYNDGRLRDADINTEQQYLNQSIFTKPIEGVLSQSEVDKLNNDVKSARLENIERIDEALEKEWTDVTDYQVEINMVAEREAQAQAVENNPDIQIVENFLNNKIIGVPDDEMLARKAKGKPMIQVDPRLIPENLKNYIDDPVLKTRKFFAKGGMSLNQAMNYFDVASPEQFLKILSEVPNREQAIQNALKIREGAIREDVEGATPLDERSRMKYYDNTAKLHLEELKTLKDKSWPSLKNAIKRIALPLPKIEEIVTRAKKAVAATPVKFLNAKRYVIAEGKAQKKAVNDVLKGAFESAFANKQSALLNNVLAKESQKMIKMINQANKRLVNILSETTQEQLEEAGPDYIKAYNYILDTFNFDNTRKGTSIEEDYQRFAERMIKEGRGDFKIPQGLAEKLSGKLSARELSAEDYLFLVDRLSRIVRDARFKNALSKQFKAAIDAEHVAQIQETAELKAQSHPDYNPDNAIMTPTPDNLGERVMAYSSGFRRQLDNLLSITTYLDEGNSDGWWTRTFYDSIKGIGAFDDGVNGEKAAINWRADLQSRYLGALKKYGLAKWKNLGNKALNIEEFKDNKYLENGRLTKAQLITLATHMGNAENKSRILNFNTTPETVMKVLEKYLTIEDMDFIQENIWNEYSERIKPRLAAKEIQSHGVEPQWTLPEKFMFKGKEYAGGYMPLKYATKGDGRAARQSARDLTDAVLGKKKLGVRDVRALDGIVFSPHTEERTGSNWLIDLDPMTIQQGFEDVIYDVSMRDPVKSAMEIISDKAIAKEIQSILGVKRYNNLVEMIAESTRSYNSYEIDLFKDSVATMKTMADTIQQGHAVAAIGLSIPSLLIQGASMRYVLSNMGIKSGMRYLSESMMSWINPYMMQSKSWSELIEFTNDIDPALKAFQEGLDTKNSNLIRKLSPNDRAFKKSNAVKNFTYNKLKNIQDAMIDIWFEGAMASVDNMMKRITALAAYRQYMDGNAPGQDLAQWSKMSDNQKQRAAKSYAQKVNAKSLTSAGMIDRALIQKTMPGILFSRYWNDGRNSINHNLQEVSNLRNNMRKAVKAARVGDYKKFDEYFTDNGERVMRMFFLSTIAGGFASMVKGIRWEDEDDEPKLIPREDEGALGYMGRVGYSYMHEMFLQNIPVVGAATFSLERFARTGKVPDVQIPFTNTLTSITTGVKVIGYDYAYNLANGLTLTEIVEGMSEKDIKALGVTSSVLTGGIPVTGLFDVYKTFSDPDENSALLGLVALPAIIAQLLGVSQDFIDNNDKEKNMTEEEMFQEIIRKAKEGKESSGLQGIVDEAKSLIAQGTTVDKEDLTEDEYYLFKIAESNGKWNARPKKMVKDPDTGKEVWEGEYLSGAFGYYQFLPSTWSDIVEMAPKSMGLTEGGLYNKKQQEKGARVWVKYIVSQFKKADVPIPVTTENIYGAHHFGVNGWIKVMEAKETKTIKSVLGEKVLEANPQIEKRGYKTIKDLKQYISDQLDIAKSKIES